MKEKFYIGAAEEYLKRLSAYCKLTLTELPEEKLPQNPSQGQIDAALAKEGRAIRAKLPTNASILSPLENYLYNLDSYCCQSIQP